MVYFVLTLRCFAYRHATTFYQLQRGFGAGDNMRGSRNFCQFYLVLSLFCSLQRGFNGLIAEKTILILYQGSIIYQGGGGVKLFPGGGGGPNVNFFRNPYTYLLFSGRGGRSRPPIPLWIRTWAMSS